MCLFPFIAWIRKLYEILRIIKEPCLSTKQYKILYVHH